MEQERAAERERWRDLAGLEVLRCYREAFCSPAALLFFPKPPYVRVRHSHSIGPYLKRESQSGLTKSCSA